MPILAEKIVFVQALFNTVIENDTGRQQANQQDKVNFESELSDNDVLVFINNRIKLHGVEKR